MLEIQALDSTTSLKSDDPKFAKTTHIVHQELFDKVFRYKMVDQAIFQLAYGYRIVYNRTEE